MNSELASTRAVESIISVLSIRKPVELEASSRWELTWPFFVGKLKLEGLKQEMKSNESKTKLKGFASLDYIVDGTIYC